MTFKPTSRLTLFLAERRALVSYESCAHVGGVWNSCRRPKHSMIASKANAHMQLHDKARFMWLGPTPRLDFVSLP